MEVFQTILNNLSNDEHRQKFEDVLQWVSTEFPQLGKRIGWSHPMFTHHETFIIGFNYAKKHLAISLEGLGIRHFADEFDKRNLHYSAMIVRFPWDQPIDFTLMKQMIDSNILDKKDTTTFWRK